MIDTPTAKNIADRMLRDEPVTPSEARDLASHVLRCHSVIHGLLEKTTEPCFDGLRREFPPMTVRSA